MPPEVLAGPAGNPSERGGLAAALLSLLAAAVAAGVGLARFAWTWAGAMDNGPTAGSWVYRPIWTILQVAFAAAATAAAVVAVTAPGGRRVLPAIAAVTAAAVLGWSLNDGAYQIIASLFYLKE